MPSRMLKVALLVREYDEAIAFFVKVVGMVLKEDTDMRNGKRWVRLAPSANDEGCEILLARAVNDEQHAAVGKQFGGRVGMFLGTDTFESDLGRLKEHGVRLVRGPVSEPYGMVVVFEDLYGNKWDLIGPASPAAPA